MFTTPTLEEAVQRARARLRADLPGTDAAVWPNTQAVTAKVLGGESFELYEFIRWVSRQKFATTADGDMLDAIGEQYALNRRPATAARGVLDIVGPVGATIDPGTVFTRSDGAIYTTDAVLILSGAGLGSVAITAAATGPGSNTVPAATMGAAAVALTSATVDADGIGGGADVEDHESYRARILFRLRNPPHGGAAHDYIAWAMAVPGITRAWVAPGALGVGTVSLWVMADANGTPDGVPMGSELEAVRAYIDDVRPVTVAQMVVSAPVIVPVTVTVSGLPALSTAAQRRVITELRDVFRRACRVSLPLDPFTLKEGQLWAAISRATGSLDHTIVSPADTLMASGRLPALEEVVYV